MAPLLCLQANQITVGLMLKFFFLLAERTKSLHAETRRAAQLQLLPQMPVTPLRSGTLGLILNSHAQSLLPPVGR